MKNLWIKKLKEPLLLDRMQKMIQHFAKNNFLKLSSDKSMKYGSNGSAVKHNIQNEWLISNFIHSDEPNFKFDNLTDNVEFKNAYSEVQPLTNSFPFSFTEIFESDLDLHHKSESLPPEIKDYFQINTGTVLRKQTLCSPDKSLQYFHRQQQERKIWWKKFSALPGRFVVSAINNDAKGKFQFVEIQAEFPWGLEVIELIKYMPLKLSFDSKFFKSAEGVKQIPHVVSTETLLEKTIITFLCDAYDGLNEETDYEMLRLHKKLAPYKIAFAGAASTEENRENLKDLATLLSKKIRKNGIPVLNLPDSCRVNVEAQYARNDAFGIPYTVFLNDATLNDGIIGIRSRDTTLKEQSHVSLIESYTEQLMRSY